MRPVVQYDSVVKDQFGTGSGLGYPQRPEPHVPSYTVGKTGGVSGEKPPDATPQSGFQPHFSGSKKIFHFFQPVPECLSWNTDVAPCLAIEPRLEDIGINLAQRHLHPAYGTVASLSVPLLAASLHDGGDARIMLPIKRLDYAIRRAFVRERKRGRLGDVGIAPERNAILHAAPPFAPGKFPEFINSENFLPPP